MAPLRIGVVGLGVISRYYLAALDQEPGVELAALCDLRAEVLAPHRNRVPCFRSHRALLAHPGLDAVVVTVPNDAHVAVCRETLEAGLPVCVEKPLTTSMSDGLFLDSLARQRSVALFTAFHRRYNDNLLALRSQVAAGPAVRSVTVRYLERIEDHVGHDDWYLDPARCGGGCVADNGPNAFDLVRLLLGELAVTRADIVRDAQGIDRRATIALTAEGGGRALVELDWSYPGEVKDVEVRLADGSVLYSDLLRGHPGFKNSLWHEYQGVLRDFAAAVAAGPGAGNDGLAALSLVHDVYRVEGVRVEGVRVEGVGGAPTVPTP